MSGPRNLVLCCDGTANEFARAQTSVVKLARAMVKDPLLQRVVYHPGIGTRDPVGAGTRIGGLLGRLAGLAFGYGLKRDVADAYVTLMNSYAPGDRLFIFGFSRGAYTARAVAALLKLYGLVMPGNEALVPYLVDMLWQGAIIGDDQDRLERFFAHASAFRDTLTATSCAPHFLGLWDTVSSVGWIGHPTSLPYTFHNPDIAVVRHAVSIDERRAFFRTNLFRASENQDAQEVWFPGVHCDVGGGYAEADSGLSKYALSWMAAEAASAGLLLDDGRLALVLGHDVLPTFANAAPEAKMHESLKGAWLLAEFVPKRHWNALTRTRGWRANLFRRRHMPDEAVVHDVAWEIGAGYERRLPTKAVRLSAHRGLEAAGPGRNDSAESP